MMKLGLFYDTETTGFPLWREPSDHPDQPHLVQLAAHLVDMEKRKIIQSMDLIVRPDEWIIPDDVSAIHGITTEYAKAVGIREDIVLDLFADLHDKCGVRIAHNESFDSRIIRIGMKRHFGHFDEEISEKFKAGTSECTCIMSTPVVKCPPTEKMKAKNMRCYKKANLQEAYKYFFGEEFDNAHSAIADVSACMSVYFAIQDDAS